MTTRADKYRFGLVPKRHFDPDAPLFVTRRLVFRGVTYERGDKLPDDIKKGKRFALWHSNRATNTPVVHFDRKGRFVADGVPIARKISPPSAAPAALPAATVQAAEAAAVREPEPVKLKAAPGETVTFTPPVRRGRSR